ncbi:DUF6498-containing protein [Salinigranum halophilum]|uniref:DUF6498-containing protein n=1 Tax=Salinigranum halophilum TaxID=2565931 RepID=UPI001F324DCC|nr:DUF6498-containing protein [Salinigranum halophilum]
MTLRDRISSWTFVLGGATALLGANLLPLVGVVALGWSLWSLLVVYWVEAFSTVVLAAVKTLFAERGSPGLSGQIEPLHELREKRGGWKVREEWPPIYPRNVPFALSMLGVWSVTVLPLSVLYWLSAAPPTVVSLDLFLGLGALVVAQVVDFVFEYIGTEEYTEVSAQEIVRTPAQLTVMLLSLGLFAAGDRTGGLLILVGVVLAKTAASLYRFYVEHLGTPLLGLGDRLVDDEDLSEPPPELDPPESEVQARVAVSATSVLLGSIWSIAFGFANRLGLGVLALSGLAIISREPLWITAGLFAIGVIAVARVLSYLFRYGTIEYQRRGDTLVAYDTLLDAPQWVVTVGPFTEFSVKNAIADRLLGTGTLTISGVESVDRDDVQLGPVTDIDRVVDTLDLPVRETERPERDPAVIGAASVLMLCFVAVPVGLFFTSRVSDAMAGALTIVFGPFLLLPVGVLLWAAFSRI